MQKRKLRIVKKSPPALGICERCNTQFKASTYNPDKATVELNAVFDAHKCKPVDTSQNALRIVREATEDKDK
jgi:hypothetical protein